MSHVLDNNTLDQINDLMSQVEEEERKYSWGRAIDLLKKIRMISSENSMKEFEANAYFKLGEIYHIAADFEKEEMEVSNKFQLAITNFQKAFYIFRDLKIEEKASAAIGFLNFLKYISETEKVEGAILLESARLNFIHSKLIYESKGKLKDSIKMAIFESRSLNLLIGEHLVRLEKNVNVKEMALEHENLIKKISDGIKEHPDFSEIYFFHYFVGITDFAIWTAIYLPVEQLREGNYINDNLTRIKGLIDIFEKLGGTLSIFMVYGLCSLFNLIISAFIVDDRFEQKRHLKISEKWLKKAEALLPKIRAGGGSNYSLEFFFFMRFTNSIFLIYLGFFSKSFKLAIADMTLMFHLMSAFFPRITNGTVAFYTLIVFLLGSLVRAIPDAQRIDFAKKALDFIDLMTIYIPLINDPRYKTFSGFKNFLLCIANAVSGDLIKDQKESSQYLERAAEIFDNVSNLESMHDNVFYRYYLMFMANSANILAENSREQSEKIKFFQLAIDFFSKSVKLGGTFIDIENMFILGNIQYKLARLMNDDEILKKSYQSYKNAIEYCTGKGYYNLVGSGYVKLAQIEDRLGNYLSAAENYKKALNSFDTALITFTYFKLGKKIEKLKNYMNAWNLIEIAKSHHMKEDHASAQSNYEQASHILSGIKEYSFEASFYSAWALLEKAELLSKQNKHQEAAATYLVSKSKFDDAIEVLNSKLSSKRISGRIKDRITKLILVAEVRETYCSARYQVETARIEGKKGNHLLAAELYNKASSLFIKLCQTYRIRRERDELEAIYHLCKAWESMEMAEVQQDPTLYTIASDLFKQASKIFPDSRLKKLSIGNSLFCTALECSALFDKTSELTSKIENYKKIKMCLRESSKNYKLGGFDQDAKWALAISTFFDGIWHLMQADNEIDFSKKRNYLSIASNYLNEALNILEDTEYEQKKEDIKNYLKMISEEKTILASALNIIEKPEISKSSIGISAPACPIEISSSVSIGEMQQTDLQTESELNWYKKIHNIYMFLPKGICIYDQSFTQKEEEDEFEPQLVAGGLTGISSLIQELTQSKTKVKIVEQEEMTLLLEHGQYVIAALVAEENLVTLRNKLAQLVEDVEDLFEDEFKNFYGNLNVFAKVGKIVRKIFEN
ncbi:MAG: hypothetical protein ACFFCM_03960 [Promethearchaeota archaeon]